eukprot:3983905-Amphidinium_carterae.4
MAVASTSSTSSRSSQKVQVMIVPCEDALQKTGEIQRGANAQTRQLQCRACRQDGASLSAQRGFRGARRLGGQDMISGQLPALPPPTFLGDSGETPDLPMMPASVYTESVGVSGGPRT